MGNPDFINGSGVSVLHYLHTVVPNVAVGGEVAYQYGPGIPGGGIAVVSAVGRYSGTTTCTFYSNITAIYPLIFLAYFL